MKTSTAKSAFSLVELLVVVGILGILLVIAVPSVGSIQRANSVSRAGNLLGDTLIAARQEASTRNRDVELRVVELGDPAEYRAFQTWMADEAGILTPSGKLITLPEGVVISSNALLSPLLTANPELAGTTNFGSHGSRPFVAVRIRAGGLPDPGISRSNNFITLRAATDTAVPPTNFFTVRMDPPTGRISTYRP